MPDIPKDLEMEPIALDVEHISYRYKKRVALADISLQCGIGQMLGILGPNGSGKTTLFRIVSALTFPHSGRIRVFGKDPTKDALAVRRRLGVVFQSGCLDSRLTVKENLWHFGQLYMLSGKTLSRRIDELAVELDIRDRINEQVATLSGGLVRRTDLARSLLHKPDLLVLDEPTTGLDPTSRQKYWQLIQEMRKRCGVTVIFTTHHFDEAEYSDSVAILDNGRLIAHGSPEVLKQGVSNDILYLQANDATALADEIRSRNGVTATAEESRMIRVETDNGHKLLASILSEYDGRIESISTGKATLADVYRKVTGRSFE